MLSSSFVFARDNKLVVFFVIFIVVAVAVIAITFAFLIVIVVIVTVAGLFTVTIIPTMRP